ncbi:MAG: hypothetical protein U9Q34_07920 [Elusimicrobiota bacterium]|nr:hypothetical protein [Elusimicrobiota bacterium]
MRKTKNLFNKTLEWCLFFISPLNPEPCPLAASRRGQMALMMVLTTLMFLLIMVPVIEKFVQNEGKWSMKNRKTSLAFNLAEAGIDRAYWKLIENTDNWNTIADGGTISGYANDTDYEDIDGGTYRINMSSGDTPREIIVIGTGKDSSSKEYRAIKVVYSKEGVVAALQAPVISGAGNANIHWGPLMSLSSMNLSGGANELFPRKYARGAITANGIYSDRDTNPNTTGSNHGPQEDPYTEWWSYNEDPGVPDVLTPDTSYYAQLAQDQEAFTGDNLYIDGNYSKNNLQDGVCTVDLGAGNGPEPKVRYITGDATFGGSKYFCGIMIVLGEVTFNSGGKNPLGSVSVDPPTDAWKEYQLNCPIRDGEKETGDMSTWDFSNTSDAYGDTAAVDEYPGDAGYHTVSEYNFKSGRVLTNDTGGIGVGGPLSYNGYIYAGTGFTAGGNTKIFGSVAVGTGGAFNGGGCDIFYDDQLDIKTINDTISRASWYEVTPSTF